MKRLFVLFLVAVMMLIPFGTINVSASNGYVTISFEDYGIRGSDKGDFPQQLGKIIKKTKVKIDSNDTIATVTLRFLKEKGITPYYTGSPEMGGGFYLASIDNFVTESGKKVSDGYGLGEFSVGSESGWMISYNNWFINKGASEFYVKNNDVIKWQYTATGLGKDIGCDFQNPTAKIKGLSFTCGKLSPKFTASNSSYTLILPKNKDEVGIDATLDNYYSKVTYGCQGKTYQNNEIIKVKNGSVITVKSVFDNGEGQVDTHTVSLKVKIPTSNSVSKKDNNKTVVSNDNSVKENNSNQKIVSNTTEKIVSNNKENNETKDIEKTTSVVGETTAEVATESVVEENTVNNNSNIKENSSVKEINTVNGFLIILIIISGIIVFAIIVCIMILYKNNKERKK